MERQKQNYRIGFPIASIYSAKLRPNRLGPNIQNQQKIKGPIQQHCIRVRFKAFNKSPP